MTGKGCWRGNIEEREGGREEGREGGREREYLRYDIFASALVLGVLVCLSGLTLGCVSWRIRERWMF